MSGRIRVSRASSNVFADLNVADPDEALAKAKLAAQIGDVVAKQGLTQAQTAELLGVDQPKVSALLRGRLSGFSTERLIRFLTALGRDVQIVVKATSRAGARGQLRVVTPR